MHTPPSGPELLRSFKFGQQRYQHVDSAAVGRLSTSMRGNQTLLPNLYLF